MAEYFDIEQATETAERLVKLLKDKGGRGMTSWYVAVSAVFRQLERELFPTQDKE